VALAVEAPEPRPPGPGADPIARVRDLELTFERDGQRVEALRGVDLEIGEGEIVGIVGESGSGKTVAALAVMGLTRAPNARVSGEVLLDGRDLLSLPEAEMRSVRGGELAMIFQDPLSSLHPLYRVGDQLAEAIRSHGDVRRAAARTRAVELLDMVGIPDPRTRVDAYPHELSGGMRQRAMIAMALANEPRVLIADEPTTALDVTVQAQILELIARLRRELGMALVIITHDLGVIAETADRVAVMYAGRIVEAADVDTVFERPEHPYTWGLLGSMPRLDQPRDAPLAPIAGRPPSLIQRPSGCHFHPRCPYVRDRHREVDPPLEPVPDQPGHAVACLLEPETRQRHWAALRSGR
jgi:peptide/nickel transport system ATP-binding protein